MSRIKKEEPIKEGATVKCSSCEAVGRYDNNDTITNKYPNSVWFDKFENRWVCHKCWLSDYTFIKVAL